VETDTEAELVPCLTAPLADAKALLAACEEAEIEAAIMRDACCGKGGCGCAPKMVLMVAAEDVPRVAQLMQDRWRALLEQEGVDPGPFAPPAPAAASPEASATESEHPACPACGTAAALVEGACSDCGLQLD
jgi:hypothetical protein